MKKVVRILGLCAIVALAFTSCKKDNQPAEISFKATINQPVNTSKTHIDNATNMLVCGEDLGMVPACVPEVMHELEILSLEIQRMPKDPNVEFAHPADAPYMSVCTTGTHDTSPLREWWEEDRETTQHFYNNQMGWWGEAPQVMSGEIAEFIINQHMYSPAMWVILPLQDWMAVDENVRLADAKAERINVPANPRHFWKYRMHMTVEELLKKDAFNKHIRALVGRRF